MRSILNLNKASHVWKFFRAGGLDQVNLQSGEDLLALDTLDQKLWVALSCPTRGLEFDPKTLELIDTDKDGRIRVPEILEAVRWASRHLKNPGDLFKGGDLPLGAINETDETGARLLAAARHVLAGLGKPQATAISVADTTDTTKFFAQTKFNGDGVVPPGSADDAETKLVIEDILATVGGKPDRNGAAGVTRDLLEQFFKEAQAYADWEQKAQAPGTLPLGAQTAAAYEALQSVRAKAEDYFARCRLAAFDGRAAGPLNCGEAEFTALAGRSLAPGDEAIAKLPLARVEASHSLPLDQGLNPAWGKAMAQVRTLAIAPLLGADKTALAEGEWRQVLDRFAPYETWQAAKPGTAVEKLGLTRIRQILEGNSRAAINKLLDQDLALTAEMDQLAAVDKLARYQRDLCTLLNNYVAFTDFYDPKKLAIFQCGTLYLDTRSCELCLKVEDVGKHAGMSNLGSIFLAYCACTRPATGEKMTIAAAFTAGDADNLREGRNGIFYDRQGRDWDATIVKVIEHPISIRQAALLPYKRLARMVGEQIERIAASREKAQEGKMAAQVAQTGQTVEQAKPGTPAPAPAQAGQVGMQNMLGVFALLSVAISSLMGGLSVAIAGFLGLRWWQMPLAILGLFLAISGPSMIIAWLKLRRRNLGPVLDACGWAINSRVKLNIPLGRVLTKLAKLPPGAARSLEDPYLDKEARLRRRIWVGVALFAVCVLALNTHPGLQLVGWLGAQLSRLF